MGSHGEGNARGEGHEGDEVRGDQGEEGGGPEGHEGDEVRGHEGEEGGGPEGHEGHEVRGHEGEEGGGPEEGHEVSGWDGTHFRSWRGSSAPVLWYVRRLRCVGVSTRSWSAGAMGHISGP